MSENQKPESVISGFHPVEEIISRTGFLDGDKLFVSRNASKRIQEILKKAQRAKVPIIHSDPEKLNKIAGSDHHQGIVLQRAESLRIPELKESDIERGGIFLVLESVQDPANLGAIVRSAAAFGADGIILSKHDSAPVGASAMKSSAGSLVNVKIMQTSGRMASFLQGYQDDFESCIIGTVLDGEILTRDIVQGIKAQHKRIFLVMGSEQSGISRLVRERCHYLLTLKQRNTVQSLNVAQAATVFLYEFCS